MNESAHRAGEARWQRRPRQRPREILDAAMRVFGQAGYGSATIADVARRAGVSPGTVVHYFRSKAELFESALRDRVERVVALGESLVAGHRGSFRELLHALLTQIWVDLMRPGTADLLLVGLLRAKSFSGPTLMMCGELQERYRRLIAGVLEGGIRRGDFHPVNPEMYARVIDSALIGLMLESRHLARFETTPPRPEVLLAQYLEMLDRALASDAGNH